MFVLLNKSFKMLYNYMCEGDHKSIPPAENSIYFGFP